MQCYKLCSIQIVQYYTLFTIADVSKLDDAPPVYAPKFVTGGGGSVGMLTIRWTVSITNLK